ncbi:Ephrin type-B receptor 5 [Takifugu flavidus]|uniref:Ephrin type-B receptor 5 n=1 Tax=Takifugu flavidus TaxID=433684 RepID=A0A5C6PJS6_9TELE|nr:Ephrin type-B receptor 5 [Takifugu flavidus]
MIAPLCLIFLSLSLSLPPVSDAAGYNRVYLRAGLDHLSGHGGSEVRRFSFVTRFWSWWFQDWPHPIEAADLKWDEVSILDDRGKLIRTFEVCNVNQNPRVQDNWLATPFLYRHAAPRVFVTLRFSVRDCASLRTPSPTCRETLTLFYKQADSQRELERTWMAEPSTNEKETREGWVKIDTIAADKSFSKVEPSSPHQYQPNRYSRINIKTRSFAPLTRKGFVLAVVDSGACVSLMGVSIFYRRCPATSLYLASYPATPSGAEPTALVPVSGTCVAHSKTQGGTPPRMHCNAEGEWMVPVGGCVCDEGHEPNLNGSACLACPVGYFKSVSGSAPCSVCPANSRTSQEGSTACECRSGFYRAASDANSSACTTPPSAPVSPSWEYESGDGGVSLRWRHPVDMGGRSEVWYGVVCRICPSATITNPTSCSWCGEGVTFSPSQTNLKQTKVTLNNLLTRVTYLIQVQAMNEVSALSPFPARYTSINFTTSQSVPSTVPMMHQLSRAPDSITLSWPQPDRPNGDILEYQLRYYDKGSDVDSAASVYSETNTVTVGSLVAGSIYAFQIRARNERGYGPYSNTVYFTTLPLEEHSHQIQNRLPLLVGSIMGGAAFLLVVIAIIVVVVFRSKRRESPYSNRLQRYISNRGGVKYYVDPSTYEDPSEAVKEFAREIDPTHLKIEEVIGAVVTYYVMKAVADQYRLPAPHSCPPALHSLMLQCWQADRGDRPTFETVLSSLDRLIRHPASLKTEPSRSCSQPLLSPTPTDLSAVSTVHDWLKALRMERYQEEFDRAHVDTLDRISLLTMEDIQNLGVILLGHQRKIFNAAQQLRAYLTQGQVEV